MAYHSALIMNLIKLKGTAKLTAQGEQVCIKDSKHILFEILASRTRLKLKNTTEARFALMNYLALSVSLHYILPLCL